MNITKKFSFCAAHKLLNYNGKCSQIHGHNYGLHITVCGDVDKNTGMVVDFNTIKEIVNSKVLSILDYANLNEIIEQPTAENIALWIWNELKHHLNLSKITLYETKDSYVEYFGD